MESTGESRTVGIFQIYCHCTCRKRGVSLSLSLSLSLSHSLLDDYAGALLEKKKKKKLRLFSIGVGRSWG